MFSSRRSGRKESRRRTFSLCFLLFDSDQDAFQLCLVDEPQTISRIVRSSPQMSKLNKTRKTFLRKVYEEDWQFKGTRSLGPMKYLQLELWVCRYIFILWSKYRLIPLWSSTSTGLLPGNGHLAQSNSVGQGLAWYKSYDCSPWLTIFHLLHCSVDFGEQLSTKIRDYASIITKQWWF